MDTFSYLVFLSGAILQYFNKTSPLLIKQQFIPANESYFTAALKLIQRFRTFASQNKKHLNFYSYGF
ncbi:MAG: hypothetical protein CFE24_01770 [Flavobacterium sp. BFFFF2]|nr:MAG: hypothetical protein CFE24_01770 [Flavobacterium sp. BFFFF2]